MTKQLVNREEQDKVIAPLVKSTVDPCGALTLSFPKKIEEMIQQLSHAAFYDNISDIPSHVVRKHPGKMCYPIKVDLERLAIEGQRQIVGEIKRISLSS
jgi:hypothetical protein